MAADIAGIVDAGEDDDEDGDDGDDDEVEAQDCPDEACRTNGPRMAVPECRPTSFR